MILLVDKKKKIFLILMERSSSSEYTLEDSTDVLKNVAKLGSVENLLGTYVDLYHGTQGESRAKEFMYQYALDACHRGDVSTASRLACLYVDDPNRYDVLNNFIQSNLVQYAGRERPSPKRFSGSWILPSATYKTGEPHYTFSEIYSGEKKNRKKRSPRYTFSKAYSGKSKSPKYTFSKAYSGKSPKYTYSERYSGSDYEFSSPFTGYYQGVNLNVAPNDILLELMSQMDYETLKNFCQGNKRIKEICHSSLGKEIMKRKKLEFIPVIDNWNYDEGRIRALYKLSAAQKKMVHGTGTYDIDHLMIKNPNIWIKEANILFAFNPKYAQAISHPVKHYNFKMNIITLENDKKLKLGKPLRKTKIPESLGDKYQYIFDNDTELAYYISDKKQGQKFLKSLKQEAKSEGLNWSMFPIRFYHF